MDAAACRLYSPALPTTRARSAQSQVHMNSRIQELAAEIKRLEAELSVEIQRIRIRTYEIRDKTVRFSEEVRRKHRAQAEHLLVYLRRAQLKHILTAPIIWLCLVPAVLLDLVVTLYQSICFPVYGIPRVVRAQYVIIDRHHLAYLNAIEKLNCLYCSYFNGLVAYVGEVAGRTEQYWCPIKHAARLKQAHSRYARFTEYGDSDAWRQQAPSLRRDFQDLQAGSETPDPQPGTEPPP
jgi:hypothetical protein